MKRRKENNTKITENAKKDFEQRQKQAFSKRIPQQYLNFDIEKILENFNKINANKVKKWINSKNKTKFLIISGTKGLGKTSLAVSVVLKSIDSINTSAHFIGFSEMMHELSFGDVEGKRDLKKFIRPNYLIIDDFGVLGRTMSEHQLKIFYQIIEQRWSNNNKYTLITTNMKLAGEGLTISNMVGESSWDRIRDSLLHIHTTGESLRG